MSYQLEVARNRPLGLWLMDDTTPFQDYSGYGRLANMTGPLLKHPALVNGATYAPILGGASVASFDTPVAQAGEEIQSYTLEAVFRVVNPTGTDVDPEFSSIQVLGRPDMEDGIVIDGSVIYFITSYENSGPVVAYYDVGAMQTFHVVGVHTPGKNSLYVNGVLVAESAVNEDQMEDQFAVSSPGMQSGSTTGLLRIAVNGVAIYNYAIAPESVIRNYQMSQLAPDAESVPDGYGGVRIAMFPTRGEIFYEQSWETGVDWEDGMLTNCSIDNDLLVANAVEDFAVSGKWETVFPLDIAESSEIFGVGISWEGRGMYMEASLDGTNWFPAANNECLEIIPNGFNPSDRDLLLRVVFPGDTPVEDTYVEYISVVGYNQSQDDMDGRTITKFGNVSLRQDRRVLDYHDAWGMSLNGGGIVISPSNEDTVQASPGTIEIWARNLYASNQVQVLLDARNAANPNHPYFGTTATEYMVNGTLYINGQLTATPFVWRLGEWTLIHVVNSNTTPTTINVGQNYNGTGRGRFEVGHVAFYDNQLSAQDIQEIYLRYLGYPGLRVGDNSVISVSESPVAAEIYTHDWSIQAAG